VRTFGIDPGSDRTGYGCIESAGSRHRVVTCGALSLKPGAPFPQKLLAIHEGLTALLLRHRPDCVAVETLFYARNVRSALRLGHVRGVAVLTASQAGLPVVEYSPAEVKRAVVGYGRAEKQQVQQMVRLLLGLGAVPTPHDVADALALAICHAHTAQSRLAGPPGPRGRADAAGPAHRAQSWRQFRPPLVPS